MADFDPLKISYLVILGTDNPMEATTFQGFSRSWPHQLWALSLLATLPADVLEPNHRLEDVIAHRMGGLRSLRWAPLNVSSLLKSKAENFGPMLVCFTGEEDIAKQVADWHLAQTSPVLHLSLFEVKGALKAGYFDLEKLRVYCSEGIEAIADKLPPQYLEAARNSLKEWKPREPVELDLVGDGHNVAEPNYMTLARAGHSLKQGQPFIGKSEQDYTDFIVSRVEPILDLQAEVGVKPLHYLSLLRPLLVLAEPAFYRGLYKKMDAKGPFKDKTIARALRQLQTQRGLYTETNGDAVQAFLDSRPAQAIVAMRQSELATFTVTVGLYAAQTTSAVMRLSPGVNHVFPALSSYARSDRSRSIENRLKKRRLFDDIQNALAKALGPERIALIERDGGPFKIVADPPIEWLPIRGLPLSMRYDCSRINATPGNLMAGLLVQPATLHFTPKELQKVLVVTCFDKNDPLRDVLTGSIRTISRQWDEKVEIIFKAATTVDEFIQVVNKFEGNVMIFDGHGADNADEPIGKLVIGKELVDVWSLRGTVRIPPIVILSACDTHGIDASSQATVGNGFLFLGARTVLATMLPVGGNESALFIARLMYRLADFLPAALGARKRVLNWCEVISGMLRMALASEILNDLVGPPAMPETPRGKLQSEANADINMRETPNWYENLIEAVAKHLKKDTGDIACKAASVIARSDSIRYVQLGAPETILIDDGTIHDEVMKIYGQSPSAAATRM